MASCRANRQSLKGTLTALLLNGCLLFIAHSVPALADLPEKGAGANCESLLVSPGESQVFDIRTLDDLLRAFTMGFEPDLNDREQRAVFEIYKAMKMGDPDTYLAEDSIDQVADTLSEYPELKKLRFRNMEVELNGNQNPLTSELRNFSSSYLKSLSQAHSNLYQIEANLGYWRRILQIKEPQFVERPIQVSDQETKEEAKARVKALKAELKQQAKLALLKTLDQFLSPRARVLLLDTSVPAQRRAEELYRALLRIKKSLLKADKNLVPVHQAMVDVVHSLAVHDPRMVRSLKSPDWLERIRAFETLIEVRESFAKNLGYKSGFKEMLQVLSVQVPAGGVPDSKLSSLIKDLKQDVIKSAEDQEWTGDHRTVRHLSLSESPFRGCLGSDCSSSSYLTKALDPNYHYFTITDEEGYSEGQITVVLGTATLKGEKIAVAFVDKVQGVALEDIVWMIEAVRQSVGEQGYMLALPEDLGNHDGLSSEESISVFVGNNILTDTSHKLTNFTPHPHNYELYNEHSRADQGLLMFPVLKQKVAGPTQIRPGLVNPSWSAKRIKLDDLVKETFALKSGPIEDRLRYIPAVKGLVQAKLPSDSDFDKTLATWLKDQNEDFRLRKRVLLYEWTERKKSLLDLLGSFSRQQQIVLIQNLWDTPRYKKKLLSQPHVLPHLIVKTRGQEKIRNLLISQYSGDFSRLAVQVMNNSKLTDAKAEEVITYLRNHGKTMDVVEVINALRLFEGVTLYEEAKQNIMTQYLSLVNGEEAVGRGLATLFHPRGSSIRQLGEQLLMQVSDNGQDSMSIVRIYRDILKWHESRKAGSQLEQTGLMWMAREDVPVEDKVKLLMSLLGGGHTQFDVFLNQVPHHQLKTLWKHIDSLGSLKVFLEIAELQGAKDFLLQYAISESFLYQSEHFPQPGHPKSFMKGEKKVRMTLKEPFAMALTPVTQLQYALVMGDNPSQHVVSKRAMTLHGADFAVNGKTIMVDPNRPVENVSWIDAQIYFEEVSQFSPAYEYDLPTETQWEYASRAGMSTSFPSGDSTDGIEAYAWHKANSNAATHPVARLRANEFGLYDTHGNVSEWVKDYYSLFLPKYPRTDYQGPDDGISRVARGGSYDDERERLHFSMRDFWDPSHRFSTLGFRSVRRPK